MKQPPFDKKAPFDPARMGFAVGNPMQNPPPPKASRKRLRQILQKGQQHYNRSQFKEAEYCYQTVLRQDPDNAEALNLLGTLAVEADHYTTSIELLEKAVKLVPKNANFRNNLANSYILNDQPELAILHLHKALARQPHLIEALMNMSHACREMGKWQTALKYCRKALQIRPEFVPARLAEAGTMNDAGNNAKAAELFRKILIDEPLEFNAMIGLADARKFTPDDKDIEQFEAALGSGKLADGEKAAVLHVAGKFYNDIKDYDTAFLKFSKAKDLAGGHFEVDVYRKHVNQLTALFTPLHFLKYQGSGSPSDRPVFIVGMPRSGTTLTEQIIASHPRAFGAGELQDIGVITGEITGGKPDYEKFTDNFQNVTMAQIAQYAGRYLTTLNRHSRTATRVVDKMPHNFETLGLIALLFPNARIIHCKRNPMDNCMSIFTHHFNEAHGYSSSLKNLGRYYREYHRLMAHWKTTLPLQIFEVQYEKLVTDQEILTRKLIKFLGLEWDDACLNFHETERSVQTISKWQVRQPIYTTSIKRWKHYEKHLDPLKSALGDLFGDD